MNTPDARVSVFDVSDPFSPLLISEIPVGIEPVSVNARNSDEIWVVNEVSDSVSVVSVSNRMVMATLAVKDEPADVVFASGSAFVSKARNNQIAVFNVTNLALISNIAVFGENPRSLAVNANGTRVYAAFALSGNRTTILSRDFAPTNQTPVIDPPLRAGLPPAPQAGRIIDAIDPAWSSIIQFTMADNDIVEINVNNRSIVRYIKRVGTVNLGLAVHPVTGDLFVANTDARNLVRFEPNLRGNFVTNRLAKIAIGSGAVTNFDLNPGYSLTNFTLANRTNALAQPTAIVFEPDGTSCYVAAFGSDRIARVSATDGTVTARIELCPTAIGSDVDSTNMRGPRGLALKPSVALYVMNRIANTISIINLTNHSVVNEIPVGTFDPSPEVIRRGRGFLYDAKLSGNGTVSCASCHIDAEMDLLAWDLGDPQGHMITNLTFLTATTPGTNQAMHPMKGPMTTQTLRGLKGLEPLHWRGDRTNFQHFSGAFDTLLGRTELPDADMQAFADFIETVVFQPNPNQNLNRTYPTSFAGGNAVTGSNIFNTLIYDSVRNLTCSSCHRPPPGPGSSTNIIARQSIGEFQDFKAAHLRNIYQKTTFSPFLGQQSIGGFGILHDGLAGNITNFLDDPNFGPIGSNLSHRLNLQAFVLSFDTGMAPVVGYTRTLVATNVTTASISTDWNTLESQAIGGTNIDLIVKGTIDGLLRGFLYRPASTDYLPDSTSLPAMTRVQLTAKVLEGDTLTIMGVPPGSGERMGIDRDLDGLLDGDAVQAVDQFVTTLEDSSTNLVLSGIGGGGGLSYGILTEPTNGVLSGFNASSGVVTYTPAADYYGVDSFRFTVQEGGLMATGIVSLTISAVNDAPTLTLASNHVVVLEDSGLVTVPGFASMAPGPANESAQTITNVATLSLSDATLFAVGPSVSPDGTLSFTPAADRHGVAEVTIQAQDDGGSAHGGTNGSGAATLTITITAVNDAPVVANPIPDQFGMYGAAFDFQFDANTFVDVDGDALAYTVSGLPTGLGFDGNARRISGVPEQAGEFAVAVAAADDGLPALSVTNAFTLSLAKAPATVWLNGLAQTYDGTARVVTAGTEPEALGVTITYDGEFNAPTNAGSYQAVGTINDANHAGAATNTLTVSPAALTASAHDAVRWFGAPDPVFSGSITGVQDGDELTASYSTTATAASPVGSYAIVPVLVDPGQKLGNYEVTLHNGWLTILGVPRLLSMAEAPEGNFKLLWAVSPQRSYEFQFKDQLGAADWLVKTQFTTAVNEMSVELEDEPGVEEHRFYRLVDVTPP
ncbi:MAG: beta-propeller fold lactonase family protein [Verrucomicrobiae bacterium]|nr:beta-propeller fold lactonase family protein [Verrucomicrobiae bacterium]